MALGAGVACRISIIDLFLFSFLDLEAEVAGEAAGAVACAVVGMVAGTVGGAVGGAVGGMVVGTLGVASSLSAPSVYSRESISNANFQRLRGFGWPWRSFEFNHSYGYEESDDERRNLTTNS